MRGVRLLLGLLPTTAVGMWLGTELLVSGDTAGLKRALGAVVVAAGAWLLYEARSGSAQGDQQPPLTIQEDQKRRGKKTWWSLPVGLAVGALAGLFGTGGPPVIIFLKDRRLNKGPFRATLLWFFLLVSVLRGISYLRAGLLTTNELTAALWLLPPSLLGMLLGMGVHRRVSEGQFRTTVSALLVPLGCLLAIGGGR